MVVVLLRIASRHCAALGSLFESAADASGTSRAYVSIQCPKLTLPRCLDIFHGTSCSHYMIAGTA